MGLLDFHSTKNVLVHLKHTGFWLSADVKPMSNDLGHLMP